MTLFLIAHESAGNAGFWSEYIALLTDGPHIALELTLILVFDVILGMVLWPAIKNRVRKHDVEVHGIEHDHD